MIFDIGRILLELLAAVIIQFTPADIYLDGNSHTWGDSDSRWHIVEPEKKGTDALQLFFSRFDGEVLSNDSITIVAHKNKDGKYVWDSYQRNFDTAPKSFTVKLNDAGAFMTTLQAFSPFVWNTPEFKFTLAKSSQRHRDDIDSTELLYTNNQYAITVILDKYGVWGLSISATKQEFDTAEYKLRIERMSP